MAKTLEQNIQQAVDDFAAIKDKIVEKGVDVPAGTPTRDYGTKVEAVYEAGIDSVASDIDEQIQRLNEEIEGAEEGQTLKEQIIQEEYNKFWDILQNSGNLTTYDAIFSSPSWNDENFKPKYDIYPGRSTFSHESLDQHSNITDLRPETIGVNIIWDRCTNFNYIFKNMPIKYVGIIDMTTAANGQCFLYRNNKLESVEKIILPPQSANIAFKTHGFAGLTNLKEIRFEGYFYGNVEIKNSKLLSHDSIVSIINALSPDISDVTLALHLDAVNKAFETSEGAMDGSTSNEWLALIATRSNWTISLNP